MFPLDCSLSTVAMQPPAHSQHPGVCWMEGWILWARKRDPLISKEHPSVPPPRISGRPWVGGAGLPRQPLSDSASPPHPHTALPGPTAPQDGEIPQAWLLRATLIRGQSGPLGTRAGDSTLSACWPAGRVVTKLAKDTEGRRRACHTCAGALRQALGLSAPISRPGRWGARTGSADL